MTKRLVSLSELKKEYFRSGILTKKVLSLYVVSGKRKKYYSRSVPNVYSEFYYFSFSSAIKAFLMFLKGFAPALPSSNAYLTVEIE